MNDQKIQLALQDTDRVLEGYFSSLGNYTHTIRSQLRAQGSVLRDETTLRIAEAETELTRDIALLVSSAEYHTLSAYYRASPGLIDIIKAVIKVVKLVVDTVRFINDLIQVITGENLAYWLDKLIPGFQEAWYKIMGKISEFSGMLGWGVDGVHHLINIASMGTNTWGMVTGRDMPAVTIERYNHINRALESFNSNLKGWQTDPGRMIESLFSIESSMGFSQGSDFINNIVNKLSGATEKVGEIATGFGQMTSELLAIRNDMPGFIAKNIPQALWDSVERVDTAVNDRILPALQNVTDKLEELDAAFEAQRKRAQELADRIAHPGDLLAEIDSLPDYVRKDQEIKIGDIASRKLGSDNAAAWESERVDLRQFDKIYAALTAPVPAPEFMELEVPGRGAVTGIIEEPRETWIVGDY